MIFLCNHLLVLDYGIKNVRLGTSRECVQENFQIIEASDFEIMTELNDIIKLYQCL